jgi:hypothetical protein
MCLSIQNPSQLPTIFGGGYVPEDHSDETRRNLPPAEREALEFSEFLKRLKTLCRSEEE